jgi:Tol biopolymer transport system component
MWVLVLVGLSGTFSCAAPDPEAGSSTGFDVTGPYLGQEAPGGSAQVFAPGIISTGLYTRDVAMMPDGGEFYFGVMSGGHAVIMETYLEEDGWTTPEVAPFSGDTRYLDLEPAISPDGQRFYFLSTRLPAGQEPSEDQVGAWVNQDIWVMDREGDAWGEPYNLGPPVNTEAPEFFPSLTTDGTIYFTRGSDDTPESYIYRSRLVDGHYQEPERLGPEVNSTPSQFNAFIAPDESYLILCTGGRDDSLGGTDYYVAFRYEDDTWSQPINLGPEVNTPANGEFSPYVSPDGRFLFFMSSRRRSPEAVPDNLSRQYLLDLHAGHENGNASIYWIDAGFIQGLRPER